MRVVHRAPLQAAVVIFALIIPLTGVHSEWIENGTPVHLQAFSQTDNTIASDGAGGAFVAWADSRDETSWDIYVQYIDAWGNGAWTEGGVEVCGEATSDQDAPVVVADGAGGAIIAWEDERSGRQDLYAQRVDGSGAVQWAADGVPICTEPSHNYLYSIRMVADGTGGAIIAWLDARDGDLDIYAQRVDASGAVQWTVDGIPVTSNSSYDSSLRLHPDGAGGAIMAWAGTGIRTQRIDASGTVLWAAGGVRLLNIATYYGWPDVTSDGAGGAIVTWQDERYATVNEPDVFAQRVDAAGNVLWAADGVEICVIVDEYVQYPAIVTDGNHGAIIAWCDTRDDVFGDIYAQRVDGNGDLLWVTNGVPVCTVPTEQIYPKLVTDDLGGAILVWRDKRNRINQDIYVQHIDQVGSLLWDSGGMPVCVAIDDPSLYEPYIVSDGLGGALITWRDFRYIVPYVYIQRIERNGYWGYPAPFIHAVRDVPGDQGGYVNLSWQPSRLDRWPEQEITHYTVWRALLPAEASCSIASGALVLERAGEFDLESAGKFEPDSTAEFGPESGRRVIRRERLGGADYYWEHVATQEAVSFPSYSAIVETMSDSAAAGPAVRYFQVCAHTGDPFICWTSPPGSGYSVDNLAPAAPLGVSGERRAEAEGLTIRWRQNTETDVFHYALYRGLSGDFNPAAMNCIAAPEDTIALDSGWRPGIGYFYKISAIDEHGNESPHTVLGPEDIHGEEAAGVPAACFLSQNYPNPFNPATTISFGLKEPAYVTLGIFDAAGRLVRTLIDGGRAAGMHREVWDGLDDAGRQAASGVYFYRLTAGPFRETKKMVLLR